MLISLKSYAVKIIFYKHRFFFYKHKTGASVGKNKGT
jgi:hypothetical protein